MNLCALLFPAEAAPSVAGPPKGGPSVSEPARSFLEEFSIAVTSAIGDIPRIGDAATADIGDSIATDALPGETEPTPTLIAGAPPEQTPRTAMTLGEIPSQPDKKDPPAEAAPVDPTQFDPATAPAIVSMPWAQAPGLPDATDPLDGAISVADPDEMKVATVGQGPRMQTNPKIPFLRPSNLPDPSDTAAAIPKALLPASPQQNPGTDALRLVAQPVGTPTAEFAPIALDAGPILVVDSGSALGQAPATDIDAPTPALQQTAIGQDAFTQELPPNNRDVATPIPSAPSDLSDGFPAISRAIAQASPDRHLEINAPHVSSGVRPTVPTPLAGPAEDLLAKSETPASDKTESAAGPPPLLRSTVAALRETLVKSIRFLAGRDEKALVIKMEPESLGEVRVEVATNKGAVEVRFFASHAEVRDALSTGLIGLKENLFRHGVDVGNVCVTADASQGFSPAGNTPGREPPPFSGGPRPAVAPATPERAAPPPARTALLHTQLLDIWI